jgi:hypothetical protein
MPSVVVSKNSISQRQVGADNISMKELRVLEEGISKYIRLRK